MEDLDRTKYVEDLSKAETEEEKKNITAQFAAQVIAFICVVTLVFFIHLFFLSQEMKLRRRSLGNIRFIGELYRIRMLTGKIMHECIRKLLKETDEESMECLCRLVTTIGAVSFVNSQRHYQKFLDFYPQPSFLFYFTSIESTNVHMYVSLSLIQPVK